MCGEPLDSSGVRAWKSWEVGVMDVETGLPFFKNGIRQIALIVEDLDEAVEN